METKYDYLTTAAALEELKELGYDKDFNIDFDELLFYAEDYVIDYLYRYEGITDPSDESTVYGLRNVKSGTKGVFVVGDLSLVEGKKRDIIINLEIKSKSQA
ncbi:MULTISPECIES: hypothetical protein [Sphingobacterium]|jgi:hypothetical protein|uniref:Phosphoribosylpyrophosphate synthetase n=1 Tax=Sphingobacterium litopenaei TaxID=2763500 RepID=A0ABR7YDR8_9SPHI|nr:MULTISPECIES: hypothetical protein [Sphingobacterium]MBD1429426.1 hypothetical protein [Sphingobacterium litopenaei]NGM73271.1 hypothetical protein [Sphingobacterium sp. SGL-16]